MYRPAVSRRPAGLNEDDVLEYLGFGEFPSIKFPAVSEAGGKA